jgi:hypothetical protein
MLRFGIIHERNFRVSMGMCFFAQCPLNKAPYWVVIKMVYVV